VWSRAEKGVFKFFTATWEGNKTRKKGFLGRTQDKQKQGKGLPPNDKKGKYVCRLRKKNGGRGGDAKKGKRADGSKKKGHFVLGVEGIRKFSNGVFRTVIK